MSLVVFAMITWLPVVLVLFALALNREARRGAGGEILRPSGTGSRKEL